MKYNIGDLLRHREYRHVYFIILFARKNNSYDGYFLNDNRGTQGMGTGFNEKNLNEYYEIIS